MAGASSSDATASEGKSDWQTQKEQQREQRRRETELKKCEEEISRLESRDKEIDEELSLPEVGTDLARLRRLSDEQTLVREKLGSLYELWETLA